MTRQRIGHGWGTSPQPQFFANQLILIWPNFYISSNFIWTSFIQIINLIHLDLFWSNLNQFDPTWSDLIQFEPILSDFNQIINLIQFEPISSDLNFQKWATNNNMTNDQKLKQACLSLKISVRALVLLHTYRSFVQKLLPVHFLIYF